MHKPDICQWLTVLCASEDSKIRSGKTSAAAEVWTSFHELLYSRPHETGTYFTQKPSQDMLTLLHLAVKVNRRHWWWTWKIAQSRLLMLRDMGIRSPYCCRYQHESTIKFHWHLQISSSAVWFGSVCFFSQTTQGKFGRNSLWHN